MVKNPPDNAGDAKPSGSIPGSRRTPGVGNGNPLQYSCPGNAMGRGAGWATGVHAVTESDKTEHTHTHTQQRISRMYGTQHAMPLTKLHGPVYHSVLATAL